MTARALVLAIAALALPVLLAPRAAAGVIVVDPPNGPSAQAAIDAASAGDILLLKPSASEPMTDLFVSGKGLTLVGDFAGTTFRKLSIVGVPGGQQMTIRGLRIGSINDGIPSIDATAAVTVGSSLGSVWFDGCAIISPKQETGLYIFGGSSPGPPGASVSGSASVLFTDCEITGGLGASPANDCFMSGGPPSPGGPGVSVSASRVTLHGTVCTGGRGSFGGQCTSTTSGGAGLRASGLSSVHIAASEIVGGLGGVASFAWPEGASGSGLVVSGTEPAVTLRDSLVVHGAGASFDPDVVAPDGTVTSYPAPARTLAVTSPLREGEVGHLTIDGEQGDFAGLFAAFTGGTLPIAVKQGVFSLGSPFFGPILLGTNHDPNGNWDIAFTAPPLNPPALAGQSLLLQLVVHDGVQVTFEGTTSLTLVDEVIP